MNVINTCYSKLVPPFHLWRVAATKGVVLFAWAAHVQAQSVGVFPAKTEGRVLGGDVAAAQLQYWPALLASPTRATEKSHPTPDNWFAEVIRANIDKDARVNAARAQADVARAEVDQAVAKLRPTVQLSGNSSLESNRYSSDQSTTLLPDAGRSKQNNLTLSGSQALYRPTEVLRLRQARAQLHRAEILAEVEVRQFAVRAAQTLSEYWRATDAVDVAVEAGIDAAVRAKIAQHQSRLGQMAPHEGALLAARKATAKAELQAAQYEQGKRLRALRTLLPAADASAVSTVLPEPEMGVISAWIARSRTQSLDVTAAKAAREAASLAVDTERSGHWPTVDLTMRVSEGRPSLTATQGRYDSTSGWSVGVQITLPLYSGGGQQASVRRALSLQEKAEQDVVAAEDEAERLTADAYMDVLAARIRLPALAVQTRVQSTAQSAKERAYRAGVVLESDLSTARMEQMRATGELKAARYAGWLSAIRLFAAAGCEPVALRCDEAYLPEALDAIDRSRTHVKGKQ